MVQRKSHEKFEQPQAKAMRIDSMSDKLKPSSRLQHVSTSTGKETGGRTRKEIPRGDRLLPHKKSPQSSPSPHYMKPTTSSDARKERGQVQFSAPKPPPRSCSVKNDSRSPSISSTFVAPPVTKSLKTLARKASLRPRRPSMKKISAASVLSPRKSVNRATCSSTMKDSKFPNVLDLNPGAGVEAELTSTVKVCPFDYCSLNGRRHHHLKRLASVRRRSLKTQRSIQLRRLPSVRKRSFRKGRRSIISGKIKISRGFKISPVVEEAGDDFFVEIFARPPENNLGHRSKGAEFGREISKILRNLEFIEENEEYSEEEDEELNGTMGFIEIPEIYSRISFGDNLDQSSDISLDDLYDDASIPASEAKQETLCLRDNQGHWICGCCGNSCLIDEKEDGFYGDTETENVESSFGVGIDSNLEVSQKDDDERCSFTMDYEGEAAALFAGRKVKSFGSFDEIDLSVDLEIDDSVVHGVSVSSVLPSQRYDLSDTLTMKISDSIDLQESNLVLDNSSVVEATDDEAGKGSVIGVLERINSQAESLESDVAAGNGRTDMNERVGDKTGNCNSSERGKSMPGDNNEHEQGQANLRVDEVAGDGFTEGSNINAFSSEESEFPTRDECSENINLNEENESGNSEAESKNVIQDLAQSESATDDGSQNNINLNGKDDEYNINIFGSEESEQDHKQSDFAIDDGSMDNVNFSDVADETETRGIKEEEICSGYKCNRSDQDDQSKASQDDEDPNNINLDAEDKDEAGCDAAEGRNSIANEIFEQYFEESELSAERTEDINSSSSLNETSEEDDYAGSELSTSDENRYKNLSVSTEDKIEAGKPTDSDLLIVLIEETNSEYNQMSANDQLEHTDLSDNGTSSGNLINLENGKTNCNEEVKCIPTPKVYRKQKSRRRSFNRRKSFEMEMVRLINPRAPCFLPLNPESNGEKVDLRHQEMDEDKNPDDWMIDCALQKLVKKLAPARKRKVALLVEAFEAVVPNSSITSSTADLGKPIQACSKWCQR